MLNFQGASDEFLRINAEALKGVRTNVRVRGRSERLKPVDEFDSDLNRQAYHNWAPTTGAILTLYEPASLNLHVAGEKLRRYTPDLWLLFPSGELWIIEVKGSFKAHASGRSSKINLEHAAVEYAWLGRWYMLLPGNVTHHTGQVLTWKLIEVNGAPAPQPKKKGRGK